MTRNRRGVVQLVAILSAALAGAGIAFAAETPAKGASISDLSLTAQPGRYTYVSGDSGLFRELHWMDTGYVAGATDFSSSGKLMDDIEFESAGHALVDENDYGAELEIKKEDLWFFKGEYTEFRKYFDTSGGFYRNFTMLNAVDADKDMRLNIGKIELELGITPKNFPDITLLYEREYKQGTKSRLTWQSLVGGGTFGGATTRKVTPSWQDIDEVVNKFGVKAEDDFSGFHWNAEQNWEYVRSNNMRKEQLASVNSTANQIYSREQYTEPRSDLISSQLNIDRWFMKEKVYASSGFRFAQINSRELENLFELNANGIPANFSTNSEQVRDSYSDNLHTTNTWVGSVMSRLWDPFTLILKSKAETVRRSSASTYMKDKSPNDAGGLVGPNGVIDDTSVSDNEEAVYDYGESISLRYAGIPGVSVYNDYDFEQVRNKLNENRAGTSAGEVFNREDITHMFRSVYTLGARFFPLHKVTATIQGRHREDDVRYNHTSFAVSTTAKSVFVDSQFITTDEASAKLAWKPSRWFQPAIRYQLQNRDTETVGLPDSSVSVVAKQLVSIYTADLVSQPMDNLLTTVSFSYQDGKIYTPASERDTIYNIPTTDLDVYSALFSAVWTINDKWTFTGTAAYSQATDFIDYGAVGMPYSSDYNKTDVTAALDWQVTKTVHLLPTYAFYTYHGDPDSNPGNYNAHLTMLEVKIDWA